MTNKRILRDIAEIIKYPLDEQGIFYKYEDDNIKRGSVLIIGQEGTPYQYGYYMFDVLFPDDYPLSPPTVTFCTNDPYSRTRFNPNLYRNGKVCLSVLNTWRGEGWTSCITLKSVLLSVASILNNNPLQNEPFITNVNTECELYNRAIEYKNIEISIYYFLKNREKFKHYNYFKDVVNHKFRENYDNIIKIIDENIDNNEPSIFIKIYNMLTYIDYKLIKRNILNLQIEI
jgi:ubiquitin-conjugating enzyme E2 Z